MLVAAIGSDGYKFFLLLHLAAVVVAFAPAFVWPYMMRLQRTEGPNSAAGGALGRLLDPMMHGGSLVLAGLFGVILILMSDEVFEFSQMWISSAFLLWFLMLGVFFAGLVPAQRQVAGGDADGDMRLAMSYGGMHLLLLLQLIVMVWKPGL